MRGPDIMSDRFAAEILKPESWPEWDAFIDAIDQGTVFHRTDWLTALASDLSLLVVRNKSGLIVGGLPLVRRPIGWHVTYRLPQFCPYAGVVLDAPAPAKLANQYGEQKEKAVAILRAMPPAAMVRFSLHWSNHDAQPYQWHGYKVTVSHTYIIEADRTLEEFRQGVDSEQRNRVFKAQKEGLSVWTTEDIDQYLPMNRMTFERQGLAPPMNDDRYRRLWADAGRRHGTIDLAGKPPDPQAGGVVVHDRRCSYLLFSGGDPAQRNASAGSLILWQAIQDALSKGRSFDFEGSTLPGVERFYRAWGGRLCSVFHAERISSLPIALLRGWQDFRTNRSAFLRFHNFK
jgi:Acetyltransferase (GNAT) domain